MSNSVTTQAAFVAISVVVLISTSSSAFAFECISKKRLAELQGEKWSSYSFTHWGTKHSGKVKYLPSGHVHAVSKGKTYNRGTWRIANGFVVRFAPDRPGKKLYKLKIRNRCS